MERKVLALSLLILALLPAGVFAQYKNRSPADMSRRFPMPKENAAVPQSTSVPLTTSKVPTASQGMLLVDEKGSVLRLTMTGVGHVRAVSAAGYPFPSGWESSLTLKAQPNKSLSFDVRLDMNQRSVGERYGAGATLVPNVAATWISDVKDPEIYQMVTRVGDLRRMTAGKGLYFKDMNEQGVVMQWVGRTQQMSVAYLLNGLVASSDIAILDWSNSDRTLGVAASWTVLDDLPGRLFDSRLSGYGRLNGLNWVDVDWELGLSGTPASDKPGYSVLIAPSKEFKSPSFYWFSGMTFRGYYGSAITPYTNTAAEGRLFSDVRSSLFDEDLEVDSWRTDMILGARASRIQSLSFRLKSELLLFGNMWGYADYEGLNVVPDSGSQISRHFFGTGFKFALSQHHFGYVGVQNKFLTSTGAVNGATDTLLSSKWAPTVVAGIKFKF